MQKENLLLKTQFEVRSTFRRLAYQLVRDRNVRIVKGKGAGLMFNPAHSNPAYALGTNELPVQVALAEHLTRGDVFFDIGANVGFFSTIAARIVGRDGQVVAFEPVPDNAQAIRHNARLNRFSNINVIEMAVSNRCGEAQLQITETSGGATLLSAGVVKEPHEIAFVPLITIDAYIQQQDFPYAIPTVIKIDVEDAEMSVLLGMAHTLRFHRPVIIYEIDDQNEMSFLLKSLSCESYLKGFGYHITRLKDSYPDSGWMVANYIATPN